MKDGGVPIMAANFTVDRFVAVVIAGTVADPGFDAATGHPHGKSFDVVIASVLTFCMREFESVSDTWSAWDQSKSLGFRRSCAGLRIARTRTSSSAM